MPNYLFLRPIIEIMTAGGIPLDRITVLIATGLHRPNEGAEMDELVGDPWVLENVRVENHFALNDADHVDLGVTEGRGVPIKLDRRFVEAELKIATGLVEPHFMAGFSGGRKVVAPGVAHHETIRTFHSARFMEDPAARECNLTGNPLHEEQLEIVRRLGDVYALNTVIDDKRNLVFCSFGEIIESHLSAVDFRAAQERLVRLGPEAFLKTLLAKDFADVDEWQTEMQLKPMRVGRIQLYSGTLSDSDHAVTGVDRITDLHDAIAASIAHHGDAAVAVIPEGPYVVPKAAAGPG